MDRAYLCEHLLKLAKLIYGKDNRDSCFAKRVKGKYLFGYRNAEKTVLNRVTKPIAIYLSLSETRFMELLENKKPIKKSIKRKRKKL